MYANYEIKPTMLYMYNSPRAKRLVPQLLNMA
jgi:hypothetical protein